MRLGLHCTSTHIAVAVHSRGSVREHTREQIGSTDPLRAAERMLTRLSSSLKATGEASAVTSITFELSDILRPHLASPVHLIRISPRRPQLEADPFALPWFTDGAEDAQPRILHLTGGHNAQGQEIVPLDAGALGQLQREKRITPRFVISAVGSLLNPEHELRTGGAILDQLPGAQVQYAHQFHHTSFAVRERTAFVNLELREQADAIVTSLSVAASAHFPGARLLVATNSGGSIPLTRLAVSPVDSVASRQATEAIGAAASLGAFDGSLTYRTGADTFTCELSGGIPNVVPALLSESLGKLATPASNIRAVRQGEDEQLKRHPAGAPALDLPLPTDTLVAIGAAQLPRVDWLMTLTQVANEPDMLRAKQAAESRVHAKLVATGMPPESIRTVESLVTATSYGNPGVIALRIRAVADHGQAHSTVRRRS